MHCAAQNNKKLPKHFPNTHQQCRRGCRWSCRCRGRGCRAGFQLKLPHHVPPVPHKGLGLISMYSSASEAAGGAVAITGEAAVRATRRSYIFSAFPAPSLLVLLWCAAQIQVQPATSKRVNHTHCIFRRARTSTFRSCRCLEMHNVSTYTRRLV